MGVASFLLTLSTIVGVLAAPAAEPVVIERAGKAVNYNQNYIAGGASVTYSPNQAAGSFSINYNTNSDFVVGLGWQPGDTRYVPPLLPLEVHVLIDYPAPSTTPAPSPAPEE